MSKWTTGPARQVIRGYAHIADPLEIIYDEHRNVVAYVTDKDSAISICKLHNQKTNPPMTAQIETGMTVRTLTDGVTTDHFPTGTVCKVESKERQHDGTFMLWVTKPFTRTDGSIVQVREPFFADELEAA